MLEIEIMGQKADGDTHKISQIGREMKPFHVCLETSVYGIPIEWFIAFQSMRC